MLTAALFLFTVILFVLYLRKSSELQSFKNIHTNLHGSSGFDSIVNIMSSEITKRGATVHAFLKINKSTHMLESDNIHVPILKKNSVAKALVTALPQNLDPSNAIDKEVIDKTSANVFAIPVSMRYEYPCWKNTDCDQKGTCKNYGGNNIKCWLTPTNMCKGNKFGSYKDKLAFCLSCISFLPVGVFLVSPKSISPNKIHSFLEHTFSGFLRKSLMYDAAVFSATRDPLTNVLNKRSLLSNLSVLLKLSQRHSDFNTSLCIFDIDHFKRFNDTYGHQEGDRLLKELASLVVSNVRETDTVARYGGEEFCIALPHTDKRDALEVAEKLRKSVENNIFCGDKRVTISIGVASYPEDFSNGEPVDVNVLIEKADVALYNSKTVRNKVTAYSPGMQMKPKGNKSDKSRKPSTKPVTVGDKPSPPDDGYLASNKIDELVGF